MPFSSTRLTGCRAREFRFWFAAVRAAVAAGIFFGAITLENCTTLRARFGSAMKVNLRKVDEIPKEKSGKFRVIRNLLAP